MGKKTKTTNKKTTPKKSTTKKTTPKKTPLKSTKDILKQAEAEAAAREKETKEKSYQEGYEAGVNDTRVTVEESGLPTIDEKKQPENKPEPEKVNNNQKEDAKASEQQKETQPMNNEMTTRQKVFYYLKKVLNYAAKLGLAGWAILILFTAELPWFVMLLFLAIAVGFGTEMILEFVDFLIDVFSKKEEEKKESTPPASTEKKAA
jgi:cation transport ATPase